MAWVFQITNENFQINGPFSLVFDISAFPNIHAVVENSDLGAVQDESGAAKNETTVALVWVEVDYFRVEVEVNSAHTDWNNVFVGQN